MRSLLDRLGIGRLSLLGRLGIGRLSLLGRRGIGRLSLLGRLGIGRPRIAESCPPDCYTDHLCDSSGRYYSRQCCEDPDCNGQTCTAWNLIGTC
ncbi:MAG: hypothetical protein JO144_02485 [Actinobacteria bacterium]|nr:hypothetical protein [Actinomycetota bacterium]